MTASDYLCQFLSVLGFVLKGPATTPGDPYPVEIRFLEQVEHLLKVPVIGVAQHILLFGAEFPAPPCPLRLPALNLSSIQPDETKIPLLGPQWHVFGRSPIKSCVRFNGLRCAEQQQGNGH